MAQQPNDPPAAGRGGGALDLKEGDQVEIIVAGKREFKVGPRPPAGEGAGAAPSEGLEAPSRLEI